MPVSGDYWIVMKPAHKYSSPDVSCKRTAAKEFSYMDNMFLRRSHPVLRRQNQLLAALPAADFGRLLPHLELLPLPFGLALYESGSEQEYEYFPTTSIVSLLGVTPDGSSAEIAVVGNDGVVGIAPIMGGETTTSRAVVQSGGYAYRLRAVVLKEEFDRGGPLQHLLLRYTQALITQMAQAAVCNRYHAVEQRLRRSLLLSLDRLPSNEVTTTQRMIANLLGVRRERVTEAARKLKVADVIDYSRGKITVLDRAKLEAEVCECYSVVKREYDRLLPGTTGVGDPPSPPQERGGNRLDPRPLKSPIVCRKPARWYGPCRLPP
jgi:CRP-like cAMP-binding protein